MCRVTAAPANRASIFCVQCVAALLPQLIEQAIFVAANRFCDEGIMFDVLCSYGADKNAVNRHGLGIRVGAKQCVGMCVIERHCCPS